MMLNDLIKKKRENYLTPCQLTVLATFTQLKCLDLLPTGTKPDLKGKVRRREVKEARQSLTDLPLLSGLSIPKCPKVRLRVSLIASLLV